MIRMIAAPVSARSSRNQIEDLRLDGDVERGRRLVGDQQAAGSQASAMAIITRWRMPPESWCGYSSARAARATECCTRAACRSPTGAPPQRAKPRWRMNDLDDLIADREGSG